MRRSTKSIHVANDTAFVDVEYNFQRVFESCAAEIQPNHLVRLDKQNLPFKFIGAPPGK